VICSPARASPPLNILASFSYKADIGRIIFPTAKIKVVAVRRIGKEEVITCIDSLLEPTVRAGGCLRICIVGNNATLESPFITENTGYESVVTTCPS
jgi:hypothetical protein